MRAFAFLSAEDGAALLPNSQEVKGSVPIFRACYVIPDPNGAALHDKPRTKERTPYLALCLQPATKDSSMHRLHKSAFESPEYYRSGWNEGLNLTGTFYWPVQPPLPPPLPLPLPLLSQLTAGHRHLQPHFEEISPSVIGWNKTREGKSCIREEKKKRLPPSKEMTSGELTLASGGKERGAVLQRFPRF